MNIKSNKEFFKWLPLIISFLMGLFFGYVIDRKMTSKDTSLSNFEIRQGGYVFINPLLECESTDDKELAPFKHKVEAFVNKKATSSRPITLSVYFRELNRGIWFGINESEKFSPASLLKVSTMITYFKAAESDPAILGRKLKYQGKDDLNQMENIRTESAIGPGRSYSVNELIYRMIVYSDNNANRLLLESIAPELLDKTYVDLGVTLPDDNKPADFMTVKSYTSFFRMLFNSSYLCKDMSERALGYLSMVEFREGLVSGVPSNIKVAHKFGERAFGPDSSVKELHDCGIIYYPAHPYLLCVMTKGDDFGYLENTVRDISSLVYNEINNQHPNNNNAR